MPTIKWLVVKESSTVPAGVGFIEQGTFNGYIPATGSFIEMNSSPGSTSLTVTAQISRNVPSDTILLNPADRQRLGVNQGTSVPSVRV